MHYIDARIARPNDVLRGLSVCVSVTGNRGYRPAKSGLAHVTMRVRIPRGRGNLGMPAVGIFNKTMRHFIEILRGSLVSIVQIM